MRWIVAIGLIFSGLVSGFAAVAGGWSNGLETLWPPQSWSLRWETLWRPVPAEAALLALAVGCVVFGLSFALERRKPAVRATPRERWGGLCLLGLIVSVALVAGALGVVIFGPARGVPDELTGAIFLAGAVQTLVALVLVSSLFFLPKSRAGFAALLIVWVLETGSLAAVYFFGSGTQI